MFKFLFRSVHSALTRKKLEKGRPGLNRVSRQTAYRCCRHGVIDGQRSPSRQKMIMASTSTDDNLPDPPGLPTEFCKAEGYPPLLASQQNKTWTLDWPQPVRRTNCFVLTNEKVDGARGQGSRLWGITSGKGAPPRGASESLPP